ncbi:MAG: S4 domain-containing protein [Nitrososphaeria archaeon]
MAKKGGSTVRKREVMPTFYGVPRKRYVFVTNVNPGPNPKNLAYDPVTLIRDKLGYARTAWEAKKGIKAGMLLVNGKVVKDHQYPIGLFDVINIRDTDIYYRLVPVEGRELHPIKIQKQEKDLKIVKIIRKTKLKGGKIQYTGHDSSVYLLDDESLKIGDSLLVNLSDKKVLASFRFEEGNLGLVYRGRRVGVLGKIAEIIPSTFSRIAMVKLVVGNESVTVPKDYVIVVGKDKPAITVVGEE